MTVRPEGGDPASRAELAAFLVGLYPGETVRGHMHEVAENLTAWAAMTGRREALAWLDITAALRLSLHPDYTSTPTGG